MITIFFSLAAAPEDRKLFGKLFKHLSIQRRQDLIEVLYDSLIIPGENESASIQTFIRRANLIVLLISPDYFHSNQCFEVELQYALEQQKAGAAQIIPVLLRPTHWEAFPFEQTHLLPPDGRPVTSWKNLDQALLAVTKGIHRVVKELISRETDAPPPIKPLPLPLWTIPYRQNPFFTDRKDILTDLHTSFTSGQSLRIRTQVLSGSDGMGKTMIALAYAYRHRNEYQAILWLNATPSELLSANILTLADQLGIPAQKGSDKHQRVAAVRHWLQHHERWLVVIDNLEDFTLLNQLIPLQGNGHVLLLTSTNPKEEPDPAIPIPRMSIEDAAVLLLRRSHIISEQASHIAAPEASFLQACKIAQAVACHPLALDLAGAYIHETQCALASYLKSYRQQQRRVRFFHWRQRLAPEHSDPITPTLLLTLQKIANIDSNALRLLHLFAFLHPDMLADEMITHGAPSLTGPLATLLIDPQAFEQALALLYRFSLIHQMVDSTTVHMHRIVQAGIRKRLTQKQQNRLANQVVSLINSTFPEVSFETWEECERYLPQAQHCSTLIQDFHLTLKEAGLLLERLGFYYYERGCYEEANTYLTQALRLQEHYHPADTLALAQTLNSLGLLSQRLARYQDAKTLHQRARELRENIPGHPQLEESLHNLAVLYEHENQYHQAELLYLRVLSLDEHAGRADSPDTATTLNNLALMYYLQGHYSQARATYQQVLTIYKHTHSSDDPTLAYALNGLGALAEKYGENQQAADLYQQALTIREKVLGKEHSETAHSINKAARINELQENYQQAQVLYEQALAIGQKKLGPEHPEVAIFLNNLALLAYKQGRYQQAEPLYQQALTIYELIPEVKHADLAQVLNNLGKLYRKTHNDERAEALLRRALTIRAQIPDITHHPDTAQILSNLGDLLTNQHRYEEAEQFLQQALDILLQRFGPEHSETELVREKYASLLEHVKRNQEPTQPRQTASGQEEQRPPELPQGTQ
ncbi:MAG: toll/interleukin-1 receptor domain-containing protein [Ktedonobacteraceae bacterium]|nr:toll/interleukin-1 receptor domain-containing protein [Ktedonobacteraceae bacterium]